MHIDPENPIKSLSNIANTDIAVIGMAGKFPGAKDIDQFWNNLTNKIESISSFTDAELIKANIPKSFLDNPNYIKCKGTINNASLFDANFFGFSKHEAEILDPQYRLFLEGAWEAFEHAGYVPGDSKSKVGVYVTSSTFDSYYFNNLTTNNYILSPSEKLLRLTYNAKDFLASLVSYKLNLTGPSVNIQTACSSSLVAICNACDSLINMKCDIAIAGGVCITTPIKSGYFFQEGMILSPDGHTRPFDVNANGCVIGNGLGILVLKRLDRALADQDFIHAIIKGFAVNNDGHDKIGFTAPSIEGQKDVIRQAIEMANIQPDQISFIEGHGTGTELGDMIEITALNEVFEEQAKKISRNSIVLGSVKSNIGHLDVAAGVVGAIKVIQALKYRLFPATVNFQENNPALDLSNSPFYINQCNVSFSQNKQALLAGVSSFGMGGTNAHIIFQSVNTPLAINTEKFPVLLVISAKTLSALIRKRRALIDFFNAHKDIDLARVAYTLQVGRKNLSCRFACIAFSRNDAIEKLNCLNQQAILDINKNLTDSIDLQEYQKILSVAKSWIEGHNINWEDVFQRKYQRIPLPTYPFERREFWIDPINAENNSLLDFENSIHSQTDEEIQIQFEIILPKITAIFKSFLGMDNITASDDIYDFGGDSLLILQIIAEISRQLKITIPVIWLNKNSSAYKLSKYICEHHNQIIKANNRC